MKDLIKYYFAFGFILYFFILIFGFNIYENVIPSFVYNIFTFLSFFLLLIYFSKNKLKYSASLLLITIFFFSILNVVILDIMYYVHHGDFFQFQSIDEQTYNKWALLVQDLSLINTIQYYSEYWGHFDDLGAMMYISTLYRIVESTLIVNFANIICGVISAKLLYKLANFFMDKRYSFYTALVFFSSSFMFALESSGLKESIFILVVIATFYNYYLFYFRRQNKYIYRAILIGLLIMFFRPAVLGMLIVSIVVGLVINQRGVSIKSLSLSAVLMIVFIFVSGFLTKITNSYSSFDKSIEVRSDAVQTSGSVAVTVAAASIASFFGPLPNLIPRLDKENNAIYASGLLFKSLLSVPFWFGILYIIKRKLYQLISLIAMSLMGMLSLLYILESYELRYHLTYLPFFYILSFYYLSKLDGNKILRRRKSVRMKISYLMVFLLIAYWNYRLL